MVVEVVVLVAAEVVVLVVVSLLEFASLVEIVSFPLSSDEGVELTSSVSALIDIEDEIKMTRMTKILATYFILIIHKINGIC